MNAAVRKNREDRMDRESRRTSRSARGRMAHGAVGVAALAAMLVVTACEPGGVEGAGPVPSASSSATSSGEPGEPTKPGETGEASATPDGDSNGGSSDAGGGKAGGGSGGGGAAPACAAEDVSIGTTLEDDEGEVPKHLLITLTNTGDKKCRVYHYPHVFPGDYAGARYPMDVYEESADPETGPVTLDPGAEAHAAMLASGIPMDQYETDTISLLLHGSELGSDGSKPISVDLPRVVAFDDGARVTYWTTASGLALDFIMSD